MNLLSELNTLLSDCGIPVETGIFSDKAPDAYLVITPLSDSFELHADNRPGMDVQEARLSLYSKRKTQSSARFWMRISILPTAGTSAMNPTPAIITTPLTWQKSMNWRNNHGDHWSG